MTKARDSTLRYERWSVRVDLGDRRYGPEETDEVGDVTLEDLSFEPEALRRAHVRIISDIPAEA